jgi:hypothetical protein
MPYTQISKKLCYQIQKVLKKFSKTFKLPTLPYLLLFFEVTQTFNPLSPFPPSTNTPHPSNFQEKSHKKKPQKTPLPQALQNPSFHSFSLSDGS